MTDIRSRPAHFASRLLTVMCAFFTLFSALPAQASEDTGPTSLLISYRSTAANRPAFREYMKGAGAARFEALRKEGAIADYDLLFNWYTDASTWDAMAVIRFRSYADVERWKTVERSMPGGLDAEGLALAQPVLTASADLDWQEGSAAGDGNSRVFYVIPYEYRDAAEYRKYVDGYVIPQVKGWMREGILSRYRIFMNRYPVGDRWDALFIYEYKDLDAFGKREPTIAKVRATLRKDPDWTALNAIKQQIRSEAENVIADDLKGR